MWVLALAVFFLAIGGLICVRHDSPEHYAYVRRLFLGLCFALVLMFAGSAVIRAAAIRADAEIKPTTCNDVEKYSLPWYALGCWWYEHSS